MNRKKIGLFLTISLVIICGFTLTVLTPEKSYVTNFGVEIHVEMWHYRNGELLDYSHHAGVLTNVGADWIEDQLGDSPGTAPADWIAVSNDPSAPQATWDMIPAEINGTNMVRSQGTYVDDGTGQWNITKSFSPNGSGSCQLTGLYWSTSPNHTLLCADTFTQVNYEDGDTVQIRWSITVSGS